MADDLAAGPVRWPDLATELSYPDWIVSSLTEDLGPAPAEAALRAMNEPASMTVRPDGYVQDLASQWVTAAVAGGAGDGPARLIADLCAGPGGKATGLAYGLRDGAVAWPAGPGSEPADPTRPLVVAVDVDARRAGVVQDNAGSLGLANVAVVIADGRRPPVRQAPSTGCWSMPRARVSACSAGDRMPAGASRRPTWVAWPACNGAAGGRPASRPPGRPARLQRVHPDPGGDRRHRPVAGPGPPRGPSRPAAPRPRWERVGRGARLLPQTAGTDGMFLLALRLGEAGR